jgi:hypothetical protein
MLCCIGGVCNSKPPRKISTKRKQEVITGDDSTFFSLQQINKKPVVVIDDSVASGATGEGACGVKKPLERKHRCSQCDRSFVRCDKLQHHVDFVHLKKYHNVCDHVEDNGTKCEYKCERADNLKTHKRATHTDYRPYKCSDCPKAFATATACREHYLNKCAPKDDPDRLAYLKVRNAYARERYANNDTYRIHKQVALGLRKFMKRMGLGKHTRTKEILGCTYEELIVHLNNNDRGFVYGTSDTDYHIDHIRPIASFKLGCRFELLEACNFNNLQLLTGPENLKKSDTFTPEASEAYYKSVGGIAILALRAVWRTKEVCACESCM